jgi:hypothetical protein
MSYFIILAGAIILALLLIVVLQGNARRQKGESHLHQERNLSSSRELLRAFERSALIEYTPTDSFEHVTISVLASFLDSGKNVVLLTQAPRSGIYNDAFSAFVEKGSLKIVNITVENPNARSLIFRVAPPPKEMSQEGYSDINAVSVNNLEFLIELTSSMESRSVLIFEALTGVILALGKEKSETSYKFFSAIVEEMSSVDRTLIALLNKDALENEVLSAYEGLFVKIFKIDSGFIVSLKGGQIKLQI